MFNHLLNYPIQHPDPNWSKTDAQIYLRKYGDTSIHIIDQAFKIAGDPLSNSPPSAMQMGRVLAKVIESHIDIAPLTFEQLQRADPGATESDLERMDGIQIGTGIQPFLLRVSMAILAFIHINLPQIAIVVDVLGPVPNAPACLLPETRRQVVPLQIVESFPRILTSGYDLQNYIEVVLNRSIEFLTGQIEEIYISEHELLRRRPPFLEEYTDFHPNRFPTQQPSIKPNSPQPTQPNIIPILEKSLLAITFRPEVESVETTWRNFQIRFDERAHSLTSQIAPSFTDIFTITLAAKEIAAAINSETSENHHHAIDAVIAYILKITTPNSEWVVALDDHGQTTAGLAKAGKSQTLAGESKRLHNLILGGQNAENLVIQYFRSAGAHLNNSDPGTRNPA